MVGEEGWGGGGRIRWNKPHVARFDFFSTLRDVQACFVQPCSRGPCLAVGMFYELLPHVTAIKA